MIFSRLRRAKFSVFMLLDKFSFEKIGIVFYVVRRMQWGNIYSFVLATVDKQKTQTL